MKIREILQIELWSKRTSRKILAGIGVVIVAVFVWAAVEQYWLTPGEHNAGNVALSEIDLLQSMESASNGDFYARADEAEGKVEIARLAARTTRDKNIAFDLSGYLLLTRMHRDDLARRERLKKRNDPRLNSDLESDKDLDSQSEETRQLMRSLLHRALD
jgi:hypothetical protein